MANVLVVAEVFEGQVEEDHAFCSRFRTKGGCSALRLLHHPCHWEPSRGRRGRGRYPWRCEGAGCRRQSVVAYVAERYAPTVASVGSAFDVIVGTASAFGKDLLPRVAARLRRGLRERYQ